jgi:hypothetical protein
VLWWVVAGPSAGGGLEYSHPGPTCNPVPMQCSTPGRLSGTTCKRLGTFMLTPPPPLLESCPLEGAPAAARPLGAVHPQRASMQPDKGHLLLLAHLPWQAAKPVLQNSRAVRPSQQQTLP